jgi:hypothetical protein
VSLDDGPGDGEAEAAPVASARLRTVEALKDALALRHRDARSVVLDGELDPAA